MIFFSYTIQQYELLCTNQTYHYNCLRSSCPESSKKVSMSISTVVSAHSGSPLLQGIVSHQNNLNHNHSGFPSRLTFNCQNRKWYDLRKNEWDRNIWGRNSRTIFFALDFPCNCPLLLLIELIEEIVWVELYHNYS